MTYTNDNPVRLSIEHLDGVIPLGEYSYRDYDGELLTTLPKQVQEFNDVTGGEKCMKWVDQRTGATVSIPLDELSELREDME